MNVKKVLYPTDFSRCSKQALDEALYMASRLDAELFMLHAVVLHEADPNNPEHHFPEAAELVRILSEMATTEMASLAAHPLGRDVVTHQTEQPGFSASEVVLDYAGEIDADLIVMGTHGRWGPGRLFLGSTAEETVRYARCPVLTVREQEEPQGLESIQSILVPVDFSAHAKLGIEAAKSLAARTGARLQVLHVVELRAAPSLYDISVIEDFTDHVRQHAADALARLVEESPGPEVACDLHVVEGVAAHAISEFAEEHESGLVVIPSHGLTGIERVLIGSTAEGVIRLAPCPVLTVKPFGKNLLGSSPQEGN